MISRDSASSSASASASFSSLSALTQSFPFSSGYPRIAETHGLMILYRDDAVSSSSSSSSNLPVGRKPLVCVLGAPNHMTHADFCQFCGSFIHHILEMQIVRNDGMEDRYGVLIRFDRQDSTDNFYKHFNGTRFSSLEAEVCRVLFTVDVQYTGSIEHAPASPANSSEQPNCPVCLERLDQDNCGILTTFCNHSFHCSCISKWTDSSCPVCQYCQQQPEKSICIVCQTSENLWICVICGFVGCKRYKEGHTIEHWKETQHCYSLELETQRVWDYSGDNYVHQLTESKTGGKLLVLNAHCILLELLQEVVKAKKEKSIHQLPTQIQSYSEEAFNSINTVDAVIEPQNEALLNNNVEAIVNEYNELLNTQLENQKLIVNEFKEIINTELENQKSYFESKLREVKEDTDREISKAVDKAVTQKKQKMQAKLDRCFKEKQILGDLNENLLKNQEIWKAKIAEIEEREKKALKLKDDRLHDLNEQLKDLMVSLDSGKMTEELSLSNEIKDGTVVSIPKESSSEKGG